MNSLFADRAFQAGLRASLAVLLVVGAVVLLQRAWDVVEPLIVAVVMATALWPWVSRICETPLGSTTLRIPRLLATALVFVVTLGLAGAVLWFALRALLPDIDGVLTSFPDQTAPVREYLQPFRTGDFAGGAGQLASEVAREATSQSSQTLQVDPGNAAPVNPGALALGLFGGVVRLGLVVIFTFFLLVDGERCARWALHWLPADSRPHFERLGIRIRDRISRWVLAQMLYGSISGLIIWVTLWLFGLREPWLYAILGATLGVFPGLGPWVAMVPAFAVALGMSAWQAFAVGAFGVTMYLVDSTTLSTRIYGGLLRLPMFVVLLALLIGAALMGVWGALIAAPVAAGIQSVLEDQARPRLTFMPQEPGTSRGERAV
jgi:predicted PurR-regulated permease PerM